MNVVAQLTDVRKVFPASAGSPVPTEVLTGVSLTIHPQEFVAIMGPSGSGKSTMLNILGLLDQPTSGDYYLAGRRVSDLPEDGLRRARAQSIGFVFQAFHLIDYLSVLDNVALPLSYAGLAPSTRHTDAAAMLERVGLAHRVDALPRTLSGGERQRVAIARAVVHRPTLVLCDEPTGNLDRATTDVVIDLLRGLCDTDQSVVVVTHDPAVALVADRIFDLVDGGVRAR